MSPAPGMGVTFTILLPVHRPPVLLPYAIESVLAQSRKDFELFIICDGAPDETVEYARAAAARDARIRVRAHPKGEHYGEAYRHEALGEARGALVCQIADDDLWFPNHLDEIANLLRDFEFGNIPQMEVEPGGKLSLQAGDLASEHTRGRMTRELFNFFGPTVVGYRMSTYRRLPVGWSPAPEGIWSDLYMWRKFLALPGIACGTRIAFTNFRFAATLRRDWTLERRKQEIEIWANRARNPLSRDQFSQGFLIWMMGSLATSERRRSRQTFVAGPAKP